MTGEPGAPFGWPKLSARLPIVRRQDNGRRGLGGQMAKDRDAARRNTRMRFEQWAHNPACAANTLSAVHNVRMDRVAASLNLPVTFGQSPFALARGNQFEAALLKDGAARLLPELVKQDVLPANAAGLLDLRLKMNGGPTVAKVDDALALTRDFLLCLPGRSDTP